MNNSKKEITLIDLFGILWNARRFFVKTITLSVILGTTLAFASPKEWKANAKVFIANDQSINVSGSLGDLASLAGFNLPTSSSSGVINPYAFEDIMRSDAFIQKLLNQQFFYHNVNDSLTLKTYSELHLKKNWLEHIISLPGNILKLFKKDNNTTESIHPAFITISEEEEKLYQKLKRRISFQFDDEKGIIIMGMTIQDPMLSAQIGSFMIGYLLNYSSEYTRNINESKLDFVVEQLQVKERQFELAQSALASFRDKNHTLTSNRAKNKEQRLKSEYEFAFSIYSDLAKSYQQAQISLEEKAPIIRPLGPITVPAEESSPNKPIVVIGITFMGLIGSTLYYLIRLRIFEGK